MDEMMSRSAEDFFLRRPQHFLTFTQKSPAHEGARLSVFQFPKIPQGFLEYYFSSISVFVCEKCSPVIL